MATTTVAPAVTHIDLHTFRVESSQGGHYLLHVSADGTVRCGCKAGAFGNRCRHALAVQAHLLAVTGAERIAGLTMPTPSVRSTGTKGHRGQHAVAPARPLGGLTRTADYDGPVDPFDGLCA